jgi:serine protease inhibitor ecotin
MSCGLGQKISRKLHGRWGFSAGRFNRFSAKADSMVACPEKVDARTVQEYLGHPTSKSQRSIPTSAMVTSGKPSKCLISPKSFKQT